MDLTDQIRELVAEGVQLRHAFAELLAEPDTQRLGPPATSADLAELERTLGGPLPASYRAFLSCFDGWTMFDPDLDLLPAAAVVGAQRSARTAAWRRNATVEGDRADGWIVIGEAAHGHARYLLDPGAGADEWPVVEYEDGVETVHPTFLAMLAAQNDVYRDGLPGPEGEFDFTDI